MIKQNDESWLAAQRLSRLVRKGRFRYAKTPSEVLHTDYSIKDHLGNVRMMLTDEVKQDKYPIATLEDSKLPIEESYYSIDRNVSSPFFSAGVS